ncbi:hypothetical protein NHP190003_15970 (plasmid) [Helicobacter sp. NHP19-003]|uniref:Uncharacterized protein n=1 Tax=Helicobacter gastrocanis TaxID=2849641 RepID=A0ABN6I446_9HELI|nr:hypothetical protein NHP190003_15970 [Helicobacter sp. NHP19-003]
MLDAVQEQVAHTKNKYKDHLNPKQVTEPYKDDTDDGKYSKSLG